MLAIAVIALFAVTALLVGFSLADSAVRASHAVRRVRFERRQLASLGSGVAIEQLYPKRTAAKRSRAKLTLIAGSRRPARSSAPRLAAAA